ncbi:hypothetical protein DH2020_017548 [Rehmannia glutinosa]|uniref:O-fucosyltransferase family protein n=1 Tax=Rehmannia glutinosa TaxID=99300 RepID=A0ABR0WR84_REHGL
MQREPCLVEGYCCRCDSSPVLYNPAKFRNGKARVSKEPTSDSLNFDELSGLKEYHSCRKVTGGEYNWDKAILAKGFKNDGVKNSAYSLMFSLFDPTFLNNSPAPRNEYAPKEINAANDDREKNVVMYSRLLQMASVSLAERDLEQKESKFWKETNPQASMWIHCADKTVTRAGTVNNDTGYILVSANGGLNQQRVAVCNAVAVASLLNATLVIPKFLYSNVWKDPSQFNDIYQEETFMNILKDDINIVKELPSHLKSIDLEAIGSLVTDADLTKEATPDEYIKNIFPILLRNGIVHFLGFGNRLGFERVPSDLQRTGSLLVKRIRKYGTARSTLDEQLLGSFISTVPNIQHVTIANPSKYLALHLRFEVDMVAYSMCHFGGGENESRELQAYREEHFPLVLERLEKTKPVSPTELRKMGRCPLTPEEAALVLAGLGFDRGTYIYLAGSQIYGGKSRMHPLIGLYPNLVTKEDLLSPSELAPFRNFSSQLAALDFIACAVSDVFAMTDSGSQLSSLVSGFRTYYGRGDAPTLRPIKKRLAAILQENSTIRWHSFENRIRKMIEEGQRVHIRGSSRSIYRQPRCKECMCKNQIMPWFVGTQ